jgi:hypothetical protein
MKRSRVAIVKGFAFVFLVAVVCVIAWMRSQRMGASRAGLGKSFELDLERYLDVDPALMTYRELAPLPIEMHSLTALAVGPDNQIYVGGDQEVRMLSASGEQQLQISLDAAPRCLAVDADGTIYAGVGNHIEVFSSEGSGIAVWEAPAVDAQPVAIALRGDEVVVSELTYRQVIRYDSTGQPRGEIEGLVLFSSPNIGIAVDPQDRLWVANPGARELRCYNDDGSVESSWARPGRDIESFSGCCNPVDIAVRADGALVTAEKNIVRIKVMSPTGDLLGVVAGPRSLDQKLVHLDIALDSDGRVLVLDPVRRAVRIFVEEGE